MRTLSKHNLADLAVLLGLVAIVLWYALDAYTVSTQILNLILIVPVTSLVLILCGVQLVRQLTLGEPPSADLKPAAEAFPVIALFAAYVLTLPWLGFDVGTCLFIGLFLWFHGERRWPWLIAYSVVFASLATLFFSRMLPYPMPLLVFPGLD